MKKKNPNFQAFASPINRAHLETKSHIVSCWTLISARLASRWIEADSILCPTQHGIQRTAGVMASLWHNQKKRKKENSQKHASSGRHTFLRPVWGTFVIFMTYEWQSEQITMKYILVSFKTFNIFKATAVTACDSVIGLCLISVMH